jgi:hypothetical protein
MTTKTIKKSAILLAFLGAVTVRAENPPAPVLSPNEMKAKAEQMKKEIDDDVRHVLHLQALARKEKDVIKLTCINDKLVQIKAQQNLFETSDLQLQSAIGQSDDSPKVIYADVEKAAADIKKLRGEADGCAGELEMYKQESKTDVDRPDLDDPTEGQPFEPPELGDKPQVDVPGFATPFS